MGQKCSKGFHKSKATNACERIKRPKSSPPCKTMKQLAKDWKKLPAPAKKNYAKKGSKTAWNTFVKQKRKKCETKK